MSQKIQEADKTLQAFQKRRSTPACYPCFARKVRCRGGRPCQACIDRCHPEICHVEEFSKGSRKHARGKSKIAIATPSSSATSRSNEPNVGKLSAMSFVQNKLRTAEDKNDAVPAMGLGGRTDSFTPIILGQSSQFEARSPERTEILQYYQPFRSFVMPLYEVVPDPAAVETWIADLLNGRTAQLPSQQIAVILACLALGAQFTEAKISGRWDISRDLIIRSNDYVQKANCILEPSVEAVQALLMIGIALQNLGEPEGAWNLLGLTCRLAQSLGLHKCSDATEDGHNGAMLWTGICRQDSLLSMRYDRVPITLREHRAHSAVGLDYQYLSYSEIMRDICSLSTDTLQQPLATRCDPETILSTATTVEKVISSGGAHLHPDCQVRTLQQRFEYFALRLHSSLFIAELCRPGFPTPETEDDLTRKAICQKGLHYLVVVLESFLELCSFSNIPLRLWSLMQGAVSCAFVLALLDARSPSSAVQKLLHKVANVWMTHAEQEDSIAENQSGGTDNYGSMHTRSANLLKSILRSTYDATIQREPDVANLVSVEDSLSNIATNADPFDFHFSESLSWPSDLSLFDSALFDSILNSSIEQDWTSV